MKALLPLFLLVVLASANVFDDMIAQAVRARVQAIDAAPWVGNWQVTSTTCNTATCCCVTGTVTVTGTTTLSLHVPVTGACGGSTYVTGTVTTPEAGAGSISFMALGTTVMVTKMATDDMTASAGAGCGEASLHRNSATPDPAPWVGNWQVTSSTCNQATCCCVSGTASVSGSSTLTITTPIAGQCGGQSTVTGTATCPAAGTDTFSFAALGTTVTVTKTGTNDMTASAGAGCGQAYLHRNAAVLPTVSAFLLMLLILVASI